MAISPMVESIFWEKKMYGHPIPVPTSGHGSTVGISPSYHPMRDEEAHKHEPRNTWIPEVIFCSHHSCPTKTSPLVVTGGGYVFFKQKKSFTPNLQNPSCFSFSWRFFVPFCCQTWTKESYEKLNLVVKVRSTAFRKRTPLKINGWNIMIMEVWFRSCSFLFMGNL